MITRNDKFEILSAGTNTGGRPLVVSTWLTENHPRKGTVRTLITFEPVLDQNGQIVDIAHDDETERFIAWAVDLDALDRGELTESVLDAQNHIERWILPLSQLPQH